jgi:phage terminase Nu1 subunit (DNA packaging protein)
MILTTKQISEGFQVTPKTISLWVKRGLPKIAHGRFDFLTTMQWWSDNVYSDNDTEGIQVSKEKFWAARARIEKLKADSAEGSFLPAAQVEKDFFDIARRVRDSILNVPDRIAADLASDTSAHSINDKLIRELTQSLEELSRG